MENILLEDFYTETSSTFSPDNAGKYSSHIVLNPNHPVYKGHFPETSVAPGVCLVQIIKEILIQKLNKNLVLTHGNNIKFLSMINPLVNKEFTLDFTIHSGENGYLVSAEYLAEGKSFTKFKGTFKEF